MAYSHSSRSSTPATHATARSPAFPVVDYDHAGGGGGAPQHNKAERAELRRGPWTVDEDLALVNYISDHGEGRWNALAPAAGLKRTGKSCRLRWLNYLRPDVKRGNFTADEQLLILDLHSRYGNRWSKIAQHLPGRTDNEIKNYWRTRVQKHAKQLNCDAGSQRFKDAMRYLWMPHLVDASTTTTFLNAATANHHHHDHQSATAADQADCYYHHHHAAAAALSGVGGVTSSSSDSFATTTSDSYDAFPAMKWEPSSGYDEAAAAAAALCANVRAAEKLVSGECWAQEMGQQAWPGAAEQKPAAHVGGQFDDVELSGWVQSFSEGVAAAENGFWALEDVWRMQ